MKFLRSPSWSVKILGLVALVVSLTAAALLLHLPARGSDPEPNAEPDRTVVCFGHVDVEGGVAALYPLQPGQVQEIAVKEGALVHNGDVLLRLDHRQADYVVRQAQADLADARVALAQAQVLPRLQPIREAEQQAAVDAAAARLRSAESVLARRLEVGDLAGSKSETNAARAQRDAAKALLQAERKKLDELRLNDPHQLVSRAEQKVAAKQGQLDQALLMLDQCDLKAPGDGTILRILVRKGEALGSQPRQPAIWFCPKGPRFIRAEVDQEFGYRVAIGQGAVIHDDSSTGPTWQGKVYRISDWYTHRRSILPEPLQFNDMRTLECLITVEPGSAPLRIGQRVLVTLK